MLLDNTAEYLFWLGAAAISRSVVVGINATYRGARARAADRPHRLPGCSSRPTTYGALLDDAPHAVPARPRPAHAHPGVRRRARPRADPDREWEPAERRRPLPADLHLGLDRLPEGRALHAGPVRPDRACTSPASRELGPGNGRVRAAAVLPHQRALHRAGRRAACAASPIGSRARFSASRTMPDIRRMGATMLTYTGKVLNYILAVPPAPDDADVPLRARHRQRGLGVRHPRVRRALRLPGPRQLRLDRGGDHHPPRRDDAAGLARPRRRRRRGVRPRDRATSARRPSSTARRRLREPRRRGRRDRRTPLPATASRATTATRRRSRRRSATASTGPATSPTATPTAGSSSPAAPTSGCGSTARTSPPGRSRRS